MPAMSLKSVQQQVIRHIQGAHPRQWGENVTGVKRELNSKERVIALTLDACGGLEGSGYDNDLIRFLEANRIPATLFINSRWIDANPETFRRLAKNPLFEIANHGTEHRPLSVNGRSVYGIKGTENAAQAAAEVWENQRKIEKLTGKKPKYFRSGTAYYDEIGVQIAHLLGEEVVNYNVLGDAGATYSREQVKAALLHARPGSIVLLHMNQPSHDTAEGVMDAVPVLKKRGYRFVQLDEVPLQ
ncbi:polysaccharide deacetylase [Marinithermofilum abyssi]|uniref:Polysaccharide deacetylase n=2 Tax=Marinithermofilum abyssi TaxID=1571185 RepID=A0A8J2YEW9_9BACL|nr:polysaccharide deacetylase [Marinithermofilum abyssi]